MSDVFGAGQAVSGIAQAAGSVASASIQANAVTDAANKAQASADKAQNLLQGRYDTTRGDLSSYNQGGQWSNALIAANLNDWSQPDNRYIDQANNFTAGAQGFYNQAQDQFDAATKIGQGPDGQAALAATPGYQFALAQGEQANQNSAAARGLGVSGAAMKGAAAYATGLASQTYQQQYEDAMQSAGATQSTGDKYSGMATTSLATNSGFQGNLTNSYNKLIGVANLGESAAAQTGNNGATLGNAAASAALSGGAAAAAGAIGTGNALSGGVNGISNAISQNNALAQFNQNQNNAGYVDDGSF